MTVDVGTRLGPYEITAKLGAGGMGVVYRAMDSQLGRSVALKVLPEGLIAEPERLARFEREAKLLAQLNHPHIAHVYGLETSGPVRALVMELVEGPTLAERLESGPLPLEEALAIARQIADALEAAHEKGIVHRDLKPQNVKAPIEGKVKVLDFGLAKAMDLGSGAGSAAQLAQSPTITLGATQLGVVLGTAAYMAPEQAKGLAVDKRADIWAFGVVLYEMLRGGSLFAGETVTDTLAGVLRAEVDFNKLPAGTPPAIHRLLRSCLERNPKNRLHDIADARIVLDEVLSGRQIEGAIATPLASPAAARAPLWVRLLPWAVAAGGLIAAALALSTRTATPARLVRSDLAPPKEALYFFQGDYGAPVILSPDGSTLVFGTRAPTGGAVGTRLRRRSLATGQTSEIAGTEGAFAPFFSPDGRSIGFFTTGQLRTITLAGGAPFTVAAARAGRGGAWAPDGTIVFSPDFRDALWRVPAVGGTPTRLTTLDETKHSSHRWPVLTPAGDAVIYLAVNHAPELASQSGLRFVRIDGRDEHPIVAAQANGAIAADRLLFVRDTTLFAQPIDFQKGTLAGTPTAVADELLVDSTTWRAVFTADGERLVHAVGVTAGESRVSAFDRSGRQRQDVTPRGGYGDLALSPDGSRLVVTRGESVNALSDLWMVDLERGTETRFTYEPEAENNPAWSPDGRFVYYTSRGHADLRDRIHRKAADGLGGSELIYESSAVVDLWSRNVSPDGRFLMVITGIMPFAVKGDVQLLALDGSRRLRPVLDGPGAELDAFFSPDGKLVVYTAVEGGGGQIFLAQLGPDLRPAARWQVSLEGGRRPAWSPDGGEIVYLDERANLWSVAIDRSGGVVRVGRPTALFSTTAVQDFDSLAVGPDGRIWMVQFGEEQAEPLRLIENWTELLPR